MCIPAVCTIRLRLSITHTPLINSALFHSFGRRNPHVLHTLLRCIHVHPHYRYVFTGVQSFHNSDVSLTRPLDEAVIDLRLASRSIHLPVSGTRHTRNKISTPKFTSSSLRCSSSSSSPPFSSSSFPFFSSPSNPYLAFSSLSTAMNAPSLFSTKARANGSSLFSSTSPSTSNTSSFLCSLPSSITSSSSSVSFGSLTLFPCTSSRRAFLHQQVLIPPSPPHSVASSLCRMSSSHSSSPPSPHYPAPFSPRAPQRPSPGLVGSSSNGAAASSPTSSNIDETTSTHALTSKQESRRGEMGEAMSVSGLGAESGNGTLLVENLNNQRRGEEGGSLKDRWRPLPTPPGPHPVPGAEQDEETHPWTSKVWASAIDMRRHIFCNRSLNMRSVVAVGFDMDYTLAQYRPETFESLAYDETVKKLVSNLNYPKELLDWKFDWRYMVRGLVLDKKRGNILKMDRHKYVKVANHGFRELSREERRATYNNTPARESFDEPDFALIDTLFSLAEAYLFAQLVDFRDLHPHALPVDGDSYAKIYKDVRAAVDLCHRDGTLKNEVAANPSKYINADDQIVPMLKMIRDSGRSTFLVTNSLWDYTNVVMNYLCGKCGMAGEEKRKRDYDWLKLFDVVITGSTKPNFFKDTNRAPLFEVDIHTGMLRNTDNGTPMVQVGGMGEELATNEEGRQLLQGDQGCQVFQGGSVSHLHTMLNIAAGAEVLYVGDHIYGDILRSKKSSGWRTMLVVPELVREIDILRSTRRDRQEFKRLRYEMDSLDDSIQRTAWALRFEDGATAEAQQKMKEDIKALEKQKGEVRKRFRALMLEWHQLFHPVWGQLMKTGYQNSRFAHQIERFACLYTSHVANLFYYSPDKNYKTCEDFMPHELEILDMQK